MGSGRLQRQQRRQEGHRADLAWFPFPAVEGGAGAPTDALGRGNGFALAKNAPPEAVDFVKYLTRAESQVQCAKVFMKALGNGFLIVALSLAVQLPLSLALALMVGRDLPGRALFRTIFFMPYVFSEVITAIMWLGLYNPDPKRGFLNALLVLIPGVKAVPWLGDTTTVMPALFAVLTWKYFGLHLLLSMAGLQNIPAEIEEAARIDGAGGRQLFSHVILPLLGGTIRTSVYLL